jgi:hypothetical protein
MCQAFDKGLNLSTFYHIFKFWDRKKEVWDEKNWKTKKQMTAAKDKRGIKIPKNSNSTISKKYLLFRFVSHDMRHKQ